MLPPHSRLKSDTDIRRAMSTGIRLHGHFVLCHILRSDSEFTRFCVVVPKSVSKFAVVRNRNKRKVTECIRTKIVPRVQKGYDVVIRLKTDASEVSPEDLLKDVTQTLARILI